ncbi:MAG TPA: YggT family protein [Acidimicrobiales bacterium]|nr:YggT family protein [Acidimicrobiales bacterium]
MHAIGFVLVTVLTLFVICLFLRAILSWFPISYGSTAHRINSILVRITEPVIAPVRRVIPPLGSGGVSIDLSFLVVVIVLFFVINLIRAALL